MSTSGSRTSRSIHGRTRRAATAAVTLLLAAIVVGACASTSVTPATASGSAAPTTSPAPSSSPSDAPSAAPTPSSVASLPPVGPGGFPLAMGKAKLLAPATDGGVKAASAINDFGFDLLHKLDAKGNLIASPASIALVLAMVQPGARGNTASQMDQVLHGLGSDANGAEIVALLKALQAGTVYTDADGYIIYQETDDKGSPLPMPTPAPGQKPAAELTVSNQAFLQSGLTVLPAYLDALSSRFGAGVGVLDFAGNPDAARQTINTWASDRTRGRIPNLLQPGDLDSSTRFSLINAIYLKAGWLRPFEAVNTKPRAFHLSDGSTINVPTMAMTMETAYAAGSGWRAINLPLVNSTNMTIVVPDNMTTFQAGLNSATLKTMDTKMAGFDVVFTMPRFSNGSSLQLAAILQAMGMSDAFSSGAADLSGIDGGRDLFLGTVVHQANIDVVEDGVTAAAVTEVGGMGGAGPIRTATFNVDKPFLYFIRDSQSGTILFMGRVEDPSKTN